LPLRFRFTEHDNEHEHEQRSSPSGCGAWGTSSTPAVGRGYFPAALQAAFFVAVSLIFLFINLINPFCPDLRSHHPHHRDLRESAKSADHQIIVVVFVIVIDPALPGALVSWTISITITVALSLH
jgi:hypothetical protein